MKTTCTRRIQFCAGHRVYGHESKCAHLHGHNYVALITAEADELDSVNRVIDFSVLKEVVGGWIDKHWDHQTILFARDPLVDILGAAHGQKMYVLSTNPTAEGMARHLLATADVLLREHAAKNDLPFVRVTSVRIWETENCYADAEVG